MLLRSNPFEVFDRLERELFEPFGGTGFGRLPMNVVRSGDAVEVTFDLPGIDPDSIDVTVEGNLVTVVGERTVDRPEDGQVLVEGRPSGRFVGRVTLGDQVDLDQLQARYERGVLTLVAPVAETARPRRIEITKAGEQAKAIEAGSTGQAQPAAA